LILLLLLPLLLAHEAFYENFVQILLLK